MILRVIERKNKINTQNKNEENKNKEKNEKEKNEEQIPVWIMRQAGRYLPEYMEIKKKHSFMDICRDPEIASEITILPYKRYNIDLLVIFSDILIIFEGMGIQIDFVEKVGPVFSSKITSLEDFQKLNLNVQQVINKIHYVYEAIILTKKKIQNAVPILGFCGSPFTLFMYLTKNNKKTYEDSMKMIYEKPKEVHIILQKITDICTLHLIKQIDSGANLVQIFDSNAEVVDKNLFNEFSITYLENLIKKVKQERPHTYIILYIKNNFHEHLKKLNIDVLSITHKDMIHYGSEFYFRLFDNRIILQGALDPYILLIDNETLVKKHTKQMLDNIKYKHKYIANLGHGILPNSKVNNVQVFINTIRQG